MVRNKFIKPRNLITTNRVSSLVQARKFSSEEEFLSILEGLNDILDSQLKKIENKEVPTKDSYTAFNEKVQKSEDITKEIYQYFDNVTNNTTSDEIKASISKYITEYVTEYKNLLMEFGSSTAVKNAVLARCYRLIDRKKTFTKVVADSTIKAIKKVVNKNGNTAILYADNTLFVNGLNQFGQLGLGNKNSTGIDEWKQIDVSSIKSGVTVTDLEMGEDYLKLTLSDKTTYISGNIYKTTNVTLKNLIGDTASGQLDSTGANFTFNNSKDINTIFGIYMNQQSDFTNGDETDGFYYDSENNYLISTPLHKIETVEELQTLTTQNISKTCQVVDGEAFCKENNISTINKNKIIVTGGFIDLDTIDFKNFSFYIYYKGGVLITNLDTNTTVASYTGNDSTWSIAGPIKMDTPYRMGIRSDYGLAFTWMIKGYIRNGRKSHIKMGLSGAIYNISISCKKFVGKKGGVYLLPESSTDGASNSVFVNSRAKDYTINEVCSATRVIPSGGMDSNKEFGKTYNGTIYPYKNTFIEYKNIDESTINYENDGDFQVILSKAVNDHDKLAAVGCKIDANTISSSVSNGDYSGVVINYAKDTDGNNLYPNAVVAYMGDAVSSFNGSLKTPTIQKTTLSNNVTSFNPVGSV